MKKPIVYFQNDARFELRKLPTELIPQYKDYVDANGNYEIAHVYALAHPKLGQGLVHTSIVVKRYKNGNFETLNTFYKKMLDKDT
ncbi:hypothetical protein UFOVP128_56 [uncultured Caudovirales phage]|uniref:Uncharacterized protein n=1 Tax=uncultured Caudovirales phage TaxID=2100421 RepID=A0A6J5L9A9_9CAUD|nr:hypothetical protein UFOVP128_56 [uncultured Caudovirales phage]CAB5222094.1 hypothetical protein UFOVP243_63 [uncultured Caudovirales phage]